ncbi:MAG: hypothetical protein N2C14_27860, partial [Planctomycetales bacterium]
MRALLSLFTGGLLVVALASPAAAQPGAFGSFSSSGEAMGAVESFSTSLGSVFGGMFHAGATVQGDGVGYEGSYYTVGGGIPLYQGPLGTYWMMQGRAHLSDEGKFFGNIGFGPRIYLKDLKGTFGFTT